MGEMHELEAEIWGEGSIRETQGYFNKMQKLKWYALAFGVWVLLSAPWMLLTWMLT